MSKKWVARRLASRRRVTAVTWTREEAPIQQSGSGVDRMSDDEKRVASETRSGGSHKRLSRRHGGSDHEPWPWLALVPHPTTPAPPDCSLRVRWTWGEHGGLILDYRLLAPRRALIIPPRAAPIRVDGLWRHTCCEAFVGIRGETGYREFNFAPSGQWALYAFSDYRAPLAPPAVTDPADAPSCHCQRRRHFWRLRAQVPAALLPEITAGRDWDLGLTAVVEDREGRLSYWALCHPAAAPDFHHPAGRLPALAEPLSVPQQIWLSTARSPLSHRTDPDLRREGTG